MTYRIFRLRASLLGFACMAASGCIDLLTVDNPNEVNGRDMDAAGDPTVFSLSARQDFAQAYGLLIVHSAWFTGEALAAETYPPVNEIARRDVAPTNASLLNSLWAPLSIARASNETVVALLAERPGGGGVDAARAALFAGFAYLLMAEQFCEGAVDGARLPTAAVLAKAEARFRHAAALAGPLARGAAEDEANRIVAAALVGRARTLMQAGRSAEAAAAADSVPQDFRFDLHYVDAGRDARRLGNAVWHYTRHRASLAVAPAFRELDDPRIPVAAPSPALPAFDRRTEYWTQLKYPTYAAPIRLASKLEADYIAAEARGPAAMLSLIQRRRTANGQTPYAGGLEDADLLRELLDQRSREFFLEGRRAGDLRRHPTLLPHLRPPGSQYHKPGYDPMGTQTCYPLPAKEVDG